MPRQLAIPHRRRESGKSAAESRSKVGTRKALSPLARAIFVVAVLLIVLAIVVSDFRARDLADARQTPGTARLIRPSHPLRWLIRSRAKSPRKSPRSCSRDFRGNKNAAAAPSPTGSSIPEKSIAVLPFQNLSDDKANAYFAEGIQDEILTRLSKIAALKVISRTSTQKYKSAPDNLREVGQQLGVANLLEGSVQKSGNAVHVSVQLIRVATDEHLWAESYNRKLDDIFGVEGEVAKAIADALQAKLTGGEQQALAVKLTNNSEAYDAYLRGLAFEARASASDSANDLEKAIGFYERAVQLDPAFALAWARLSRANAFVYFLGVDSTPVRRDATERALKTARKLQPNSPETLLALAYYQYYVLRDYELAKVTFGSVRELLPSSSDAPAALAAIARRQGHWDESVAYWEQALALDPRDTQLLRSVADTYSMLRQFPAALKTYDRVLDIVPNDPDTLAFEAKIYQADGDLEQAGKLLTGLNASTHSLNIFEAKINQLFLERNFAEAIRLIQNRLTEFHDISDFERFYFQAELVGAQQWAGDVPARKPLPNDCFLRWKRSTTRIPIARFLRHGFR